VRYLSLIAVFMLCSCGDGATSSAPAASLPEDPAIAQCRAEVERYSADLAEYETAETSRRVRCDNLKMRQDQVDDDFRDLEVEFPIATPILSSCLGESNRSSALACVVATCAAREVLTGVSCEDIGERLEPLLERQESVEAALSSGCCNDVARGYFAKAVGRYRTGGSCSARRRPERPYCSLSDAEKAERDAAQAGLGNVGYEASNLAGGVSNGM
jgi:hypothetical protein